MYDKLLKSIEVLLDSKRIPENWNINRSLKLVDLDTNSI